MNKEEIKGIVEFFKKKLNLNDNITLTEVRESGHDGFKLSYDNFYSYIFFKKEDTLASVSYFFKQVMESKIYDFAREYKFKGVK